jgi:hypothetical protein
MRFSATGSTPCPKNPRGTQRNHFRFFVKNGSIFVAIRSAT